MNSESQLSVERILLLSLLASCNGEWEKPGFISLLRRINWETFLAVTSQDLYPYLASRLEAYVDCVQPPREWEVLFNARHLTVVHNLRLRHELRRIVEALRRSGIPVIALKGIVLAYTAYRDPSLRSMTDLDILVPPGERDRAHDALHELGFAYPDGVDAILPEHSTRGLASGEFCHPLRLRGSNVLLELHSCLECSEPAVTIPIREFWSRSVITDLNGLPVRTLCPEDFLLHLCLHASRAHRFESGLRSLLDLRVLLDSFANWDWASITARSVRGQCGPWMYVTLAAAQDLAGASVPDFFFKTLPQPAGFSSLRRLAEEQLWSARCGKPRLPLIPRLLAEPSWRARGRMFLNRVRLLRHEELGSGPTRVGLVQLVRLSWRRLLATISIVIPRFRHALQGGQWRLGAVWASARLTRQSNTLFRMLEQEAGRTQPKGQCEAVSGRRQHQ